MNENDVTNIIVTKDCNKHPKSKKKKKDKGKKYSIKDKSNKF